MNLALALWLLATAADDVSPRLARGSLIFESFYTDASHQTVYTQFAVSPDGAATAIRSMGKDGWGQIFLAPAPNRIFVITQGHIEVWTDGWQIYRSFYDPRDRMVTQLAPMRAGRFLALQFRGADTELVEFNADGAKLAGYALPSDEERSPWWQLEVLRDQCTVLHAARGLNDTAHRIRRYNLCTRQAGEDFASIPFSFGEDITAIRQLPGGDVLIAAATGVRHYTLDGGLLRTYPYPAHHLALTPDASGFWIVDDPAEHVQPRVRRIDISSASMAEIHPLIGESIGFNGFAVVGEWRAAAAKPKTRAARH